MPLIKETKPTQIFISIRGTVEMTIKDKLFIIIIVYYLFSMPPLLLSSHINL